MLLRVAVKCVYLHPHLQRVDWWLLWVRRRAGNDTRVVIKCDIKPFLRTRINLDEDDKVYGTSISIYVCISDTHKMLFSFFFQIRLQLLLSRIVIIRTFRDLHIYEFQIFA